MTCGDVRLLRSPTAVGERTLQKPANVSSNHNGRVLLAEDDDDLLDALTQLLRSNGHDVIPVRDGAGLLDRLSHSLLLKPDEPPPDAVVSDIRLPGFNGLSILEGLRWSGWMTPFILMSAFGDEETKERAAQVGATAFLDKPLDVARLEDLVTTAIESARSKSPHAQRALAAMFEHASFVDAIRCLREEDWDEIVIVRATPEGLEAWGRLTGEILLDRLLTVDLERLSEAEVGEIAIHWRDDHIATGSVHTALSALAAGEITSVPCVLRGGGRRGPLLSVIGRVDGGTPKLIH